MTTTTIETDLKRSVSEEVRVKWLGDDRFRVFTPFRFGDGDFFAIVLRRNGPRWVFSDEGHTYMHLSYDMDEKDLHRGPRKKAIERTLTQFGVTDDDGVLFAEIED